MGEALRETESLYFGYAPGENRFASNSITKFCLALDHNDIGSMFCHGGGQNRPA
jgi:hypothetical protein